MSELTYPIMRAFDAGSVVRTLYKRNVDWFCRAYACVARGAPGTAVPAVLATGEVTLGAGPGHALIGGPCLDHCLPLGPAGVSFQIAAEAATVLRAARRTGARVFLFIMGGVHAEAHPAIWDRLRAAYLGLLDELADHDALHAPERHVSATWHHRAHWDRWRHRTIPARAPIATMYELARPLAATTTRAISDDLRRDYVDCMFAYDPRMVRELAPWPIERLHHYENLQQLRAFSIAQAALALDGRDNVHLSFTPMPSADCAIRMTRASGAAKLPAGLGRRELLARIRGSELLASYFEAHVGLALLEPVVDAFTRHFGAAA